MILQQGLLKDLKTFLLKKIYVYRHQMMMSVLKKIRLVFMVQPITNSLILLKKFC